MIGRLEGILAEKASNRLILDVGGVGYEVHVPLSTFYELGEEGRTVVLQIHTHVKEDILALYGFLTAREKSLFLLLIQVSGIGPKLANTILSGLPVEELTSAVARSDLVRLTRIPGVGRKTAERMILELRDKVTALAPPADESIASVGALQEDVVSALVNLGYPRSRAESAVAKAVQSGPGEPFEVLIKAALRQLS